MATFDLPNHHAHHNQYHDQSERASLLTLPSELRNAIYHHVFTTTASHLPPSTPTPDPLALALRLVPSLAAPTHLTSAPPSPLSLLLVCRQIYRESRLLALTHTAFILRPRESPSPSYFTRLARPLDPAQRSALRHITLVARTTHLRALNETWGGCAFGQHATLPPHRLIPEEDDDADGEEGRDGGAEEEKGGGGGKVVVTTPLQLETLTLVPTRPAVRAEDVLAEIVGLNQCHTLAYVVCEAVKGLRGVGVVEVRNSIGCGGLTVGPCFNEVVWRLFHRSLVYRLWKWGGRSCGMRLECGSDEETEVLEREGRQWVRIYLRGGEGCGREVDEEMARLEL